jgi:hypothetical protein
MGESVRARLGGGAPKSATLHRVLRSQPGGGFHHGEGNPLPYKAVIVDEASMIDLALMERLVAALSEEARLVLIGDPDQLPSVEAGQVLTDLLSAAAAWGRGRRRRRRRRRPSGGSRDRAADAQLPRRRGGRGEGDPDGGGGGAGRRRQAAGAGSRRAVGGGAPQAGGGHG